jgi:hypothetical protein
VKFSELQSEFNHRQDLLRQAVKAFPWEKQDCYAGWLANSYLYVNNSTRILALAAGYMPFHRTDASNRFIKHAAEERGHEKLLENDLNNLGRGPDSCEVTLEMRLYYQSLYYWISPLGNPIGLIGWILSLEGLATKMGPWIYNTIERAHGAKACSFMKVHSDADPDHLNKAFLLIQSHSNDELAVVGQSLRQYSEQYVKVLTAIAQSESIPITGPQRCA